MMMKIPPRGLLFLGLSLLAMMFTVIGFGTDIWSAKAFNGVTSTKFHGDMWYTCQRDTVVATGSTSVDNCYDPTDKELNCGTLRDRVNAIRCFYILTMIVIVLCFTFSIMDYYGTLRLPFGLRPNVALVALAIAITVLSLLSWAVALSYPNTKFCNSPVALKDYPEFKWQASPFMMLMVTFVSIGMIVVAIIFDGASGSTAAEEEAPRETVQCTVN